VRRRFKRGEVHKEGRGGGEGEGEEGGELAILDGVLRAEKSHNKPRRKAGRFLTMNDRVKLLDLWQGGRVINPKLEGVVIQ